MLVTPYYQPLDICMTTSYMLLTLIIPGPHNLKIKINIFLQSFTAKLKILWETSILTYDNATKHNFQMMIVLMWIINDFLANEMLSGWSTVEKLACSYNNNLSKTLTLKE